MSQSSGNSASPVELLAEYSVRQLEAETAQRDRLDKRADTLVTTSGGLVTLVAAATALVPKPKDFDVPTVFVVLLLVGLGFFLVTIVTSQLAWLLPSRQVVVRIEDVTAAVLNDNVWDADPTQALRQLTVTDLRTISSMRMGNNVRLRQLRWAGVSQMYAVCSLVAAAVALLWSVEF